MEKSKDYPILFPQLVQKDASFSNSLPQLVQNLAIYSPIN